jgi:hypothetical protein
VPLLLLRRWLDYGGKKRAIPGCARLTPNRKLANHSNKKFHQPNRFELLKRKIAGYPQN